MADVARKVLEAICAVAFVDVSQVTFATSPMELRLDSLRLAIIGMELEEELQIQLTDEQVRQLLAAATVGEMVAAFDCEAVPG